MSTKNAEQHRGVKPQASPGRGAVPGAVKGPLTGREVPPVKRDEDSRDKKAPGAFRTISEVAEDLGVQQHVLRFWETKFSHIRPLKRGGGRRYYRPEDLALLKKIHHLLYTEGYTIKGVQKLLREKGKASVVHEEVSGDEGAPAATRSSAASAPVKKTTVQASVQGSVAFGLSPAQKSILHAMVGELKEIRKLVKPD
jgi:DNA-binding transcriptional MerR regulator